MAKAEEDSTKTIYLYTYHNKPPFVVDEELGIGLYYDLAQYLSDKDPLHTYQTNYIPRKRLDRMIEMASLDGVIIGVSPVWFDDVKQTRFLWLPSIYADRDEFVSLNTSPFEFTGPESLMGKILAGVAGYYYFGVNEAIDRRLVSRIDTIGELQVLELITLGRADFGIVSKSVFTYLNSIDDLPDVFHLSEQSHNVFLRRAFTLHQHIETYKSMLPLLESLDDDPTWQAIRAKYE
jgi:polar amino acid transport system substrate-binding protein